MYISIAGNIGSGKTTLTKMLTDHYSWVPEYETVDDNPYLNDFYSDMDRWSFNTQIYFLNKRIHQIKKIQENEQPVVQDRSIYEDANIFAPNLYAMNLMDKRDYENYITLFKFIEKFIVPPNLLIYLKADVSTLLNQIFQRNREFENSISIGYLHNLNNRYNKWIENYNQGKVLIIDVNEKDFLMKSKDFDFIVKAIDIELYG